MSYDLMSLPLTLLFVATGQSLFPEGQIESQQNLAIKFQNSSPYYSLLVDPKQDHFLMVLSLNSYEDYQFSVRGRKCDGSCNTRSVK